MRVELVTVGDELLIGDIVNGNAAWMGQALTRIGVAVSRSVVVGDTPEAITGAVNDALAHADADAVIITGGLGPTYDDRTRDVLAEMAGVALERDPMIEKRLRERAERYGVPLRPMALRMAEVPAGAAVLDNPAGSAPGLRLVLGGRPVFALPGVPYEMQAIMTGSVLPELDSGASSAQLTLRTAGVWESVIASRLASVEAMEGVDLAYLPSPAEVKVRITASGEAVLAAAEERVRDLLGPTVFGIGDETLALAVNRLLIARGESVAVAESLTGGLLGAELTSTAGSSAAFRGGVTAYATELKGSLLGVPEALLEERGAVDPQVAVEMAAGVRERLGATYGLAVTGVAGPDPQDAKPVGTVHIGISGPSGNRSVTPVLPLPSDGGRARPLVRRMTVVHALDLLRHEILGVAMVRDWEEDQEDREGLT
ncbi:CinA family nicotinamide mononucleotide deamidase-related protein [Actinocorallia longicatena]|uniref:CinA family nicotinamide mononucleotide deamidase-related protein n=1 Tax=Actinocorallia longicatena TaxID=111803 RepID=UPI0031DC2833